MLVLFFTPSLAAEKVSDHFLLPPAMEKLVGNPAIHYLAPEKAPAKSFLLGFGNYEPLHGFGPRLTRSRILIVGANELPPEDIASLIAVPLLRTFYEEVLSEEARSQYARELFMKELLPISKARFLALGSQVLCQGSSGVAWFDNWWKVRMGLPLTRSHDHHLVLINLQMADPGFQSKTGHICLGLREKGGNPDEDTIIEFRAPWYLDRIPTIVEGLNLNDNLPTRVYPENFYDWLYTQTELRNNNVRLWLLPIAKEQVQLIRAFLDLRGFHEAGQYRPLRGNCASLALLFLHRIQPLDTPLLLEKHLADLPFQASERVRRQFRETTGRDRPYPQFSMEARTRLNGLEPTAKSKMHRAQPSRRHSGAFQDLQRWENENSSSLP